jgi:hypothetical protein
VGVVEQACQEHGAQSRPAFLLLVIVQRTHSIKEYVFRLFEVLGPARFGNVKGGLGDRFVGLATFEHNE